MLSQFPDRQQHAEKKPQSLLKACGGKLLLGGAACLLWLSTVQAQEPIQIKKQTRQVQPMLWLTDAVNNQPVYKTSQPVDVSGATLQLMLPKLAQYQIQTMVVNNQRAMDLLKARPNACAGNKIITSERLNNSYASKLPQVVFPGLRIFSRADSVAAKIMAEMLDAQGRISVRKVLLEAHKLRFVVVSGRNYGAELDALIEAPQWQNRFWQREADDMAAGVVDMVRTGRIDLMLEYPNVAAHYQAQQTDGTKLVSYAIAESPAFLLGHILCSRTAQGKEMLQQFDAALADVTKTKAYLDAHLRWFAPDYHAEFRKIYNQVYHTSF
ncbi:transporter substrate-binding domain-containing protein [Rheinheimera riviphila]|uniref:Transporter substrate-binding domain-containing protein n=1 Tax=Rheinheimera riviphila TaxID=1834037 RepID=A0A437QEW9_9GAMM|nr:transporter substrate-binding domain-containing protein [Rheinheimera riviphila]RVU33090.1 transporter substrate-binding domain-containing protein [Rheinheimera riviphila]